MKRRGFIAIAAAFATTLLLTASGAAASPSWKLQPPLNPGTNDHLYGVSCSAATACTAVGTYDKTATIRATLVERWNGTSWKGQPSPNPAGATNTEFLGVSCASATACIAVGAYVSASGNVLALAEGWNGSSWAIQSVPTPTGTTFSLLAGISCTSAIACTAVGDYINSTAADVALAERWHGTKWTMQSTAKPSFAQNYRLLAVSCPTLSACIAVGYDMQGSINYPLAERWDGTSWTALFATCAQAFVNVCALLAVSCTAANACAAVGYFDSASGELPVEEDWNGTSWAAEVPPVPSSNHADLFGVSCAAGFACTWVGWYKNGAGTLVTWAGHRAPNFNQYVDVTPNPAAATRIRMIAVSCKTTNQCMGVGDYFNSSSIYKTLAERYS
jgi:hypothetical protein